MQLWLKCPVCQAQNPLTIKACSSCGASLENLPPAKRVYVLETAARPAAKAAARPATPAAPAEAAVTPPEGTPRAAKKAKAGPKPARKKKGQA
jgi:hypothetical protein